jgi:hypothetical protein
MLPLCQAHATTAPLASLLSGPGREAGGPAPFRPRYDAPMRTPRWVVIVLLVLPLLARAGASEPAADAEHQAVLAYRAKQYQTFLRHMREFAKYQPSLPRVIYNLAVAESLAGSADEAIKLLERLAATGLSFPIEKDDDFRALRPRADFQAQVRAMKANLAPRGRADAGFTMGERELLTEGVAYDPQTRTFYVSSVRHRKIIAIDEHGVQRDFITEGQDGIGGVFGMAVDAQRRVLWAASSRLPHMIGFRPEERNNAGLFKFDLATGKLLTRVGAFPDGKPHSFGDVIVASNGDAYATDSESPTMYRVNAAKRRLEVVFHDPHFKSLQGLALSADEKTLYFADYALGVFSVHLASKAIAQIEVAPTIAATGIDGLYLYHGRLIATQNGIEPHRVVAFDLERSGGPRGVTRLVGQQVLLSGDPRIADLSLGAIVGDTLYLNAAAGWAHYSDEGEPVPGTSSPPHTILKLSLPP